MIAAAAAMFDPDVEEVLLRVYNVDPHRTTLRRVWVLLQRLPLGVWQKGQGPASWTTEAYLLASVIDAVNQLTWVQVAKVSKKGKQPKPPQPTWRPGGKPKKQKMSWDQFGKALGGIEGVVSS